MCYLPRNIRFVQVWKREYKTTSIVTLTVGRNNMKNVTQLGRNILQHEPNRKNTQNLLKKKKKNIIRIIVLVSISYRFSKPKSVVDYCKSKALTDFQMICDVIHRNSSIRQSQFTCVHTQSWTRTVSGSFFIADISLRSSLNFRIHSNTALRNKPLSPSCAQNIGTRHTLRL